MSETLQTLFAGQWRHARGQRRDEPPFHWTR